jgi:hypothetical protein
MTIQYYMVHKQDAEWMIGETVSSCKHAFQMSGYDLAGLAEIAAQRGSVIVKAEGSIFNSDDKIIQRVV